MNLMRDEFPERVKQQLAKRVGYRCSSPNCENSTIGPSLSTTEAINMGVAAHITAASPGGARYDPSLTPEQRKSYDNGIWLCKYCGDLVDKDEVTYPVELLRAWKTMTEHSAGMEVHRLPQESENNLSAPKQQKNKLEDWIKDGKKRWDQLVSMDLSNEQPSRFSHGVWTAAYSVTGKFKPPALRDLKLLLRRTEKYRIGYSGYPVWAMTHDELIDLETYPYNDVLESWMGKNSDLDAVYSHFWRASPEGSFFFMRGYQEDCEFEISPGTILWVETPISEVGEILLHSHRVAKELGDEDASVAVSFVWDGLADRRLSSRSRNAPRLEGSLERTRKVCRQPSIASQFKGSVKSILTNLPKIVETITEPFYECFDLHKVSLDFIQRDISILTKGDR